MAVTGTKTVSQIVTAALRKATILAVDETAGASIAQVALEELNGMLKGWQSVPYSVFSKTSGSLALTTAASYTLSPVRPIRILSARFKDTSEMPMMEMTREEYDTLPLKTSTGIPSTFYYDRQKEAAKLYIWPVLASATAETIEYTYEREVEDIAALSDTIDLPAEWWEAAVYGLASRMVDTVPVHPNPQMIHIRARDLLADVRAQDTEGSVVFGNV